MMFDYSGLGEALIGAAAVVTAVAQLLQRKTVNRTADTVDQVHDAVSTANGIPAGELLERAEGRRIEEIPYIDRTVSEQGYVDRLNEGGRDRGHEGYTP